MSMLAIAICGMLLVFGIGVKKMEQVYDKTNVANEVIVPSVLIMNGMLLSFYDIRVTAWEHIAAHNDAEYKKLKKR